MAIQTDGHATLIELANLPNVALEEVEVSPIGVEVPAVPQTNMHNPDTETQLPAKIRNYTDGGALCHYDPAMLTDINSQVGVNQLIIIHFPDTHTWSFWGWIAEFKPATSKSKEKPTANVVFKCSNLNDSGVITKPVYA